MFIYAVFYDRNAGCIGAPPVGLVRLWRSQPYSSASTKN